jgi:pyruvate/2-oxoglutarate dehydrogenase complex dihydrolipoamide dehydrogenase (E3) component
VAGKSAPQSAELSVLVLGGGPAGITAALQAHELGARVTVLETGQVGGTSLNRGPAPVRTLARTARLARDWSSWAAYGLRGPAPKPDLAAAIANSERVVRYAHDKKDIAGHLRRLGIELAEELGQVGFRSPGVVAAADGRTWSADRFIVAVGGHAARLPIPGAELALTYADISALTSLPDRVAVIGGADTGCQIASIFADLGADVTILEAGPALIASADASISAALCGAFGDRGMTIATDTRAEELRQDGNAIAIDYQCDEVRGCTVADAVFFAVGWPANTAGLNAEAAGIAVERGAVVVDEYLRTTAEHIFAAGDVDGHMMLVQTARMEGRTAAKNAVLGLTRPAAYDVVPSGSFTDPEYGRVGMTEAEATAAAGHDPVVGIARYDDLVRPVADGRPDGFCKLIADRDSHLILGGHVLGEYSAETVQTVAAVMAAGLTVEQVAELQFAYPTFTEGVSMAALKICRTIGVGRFPEAWSYLGADD